MTTSCPKCRQGNPSNSKYCNECGTQLKPVHAETRTLRTSAKDSKIGEIVSEKYKLLEELGSGGMGIVYKAEQIKPVKRSVALKIIKLGMDTREVVARFESERQALAVMDHPNIAKVFDGGATESGRPYFVMELVRGIQIMEYCDKHKLTTKERLELFIHVCDAIQHAHQKGVIHRDLKPSNILVVVQENKPIPKIIDFGIAKATEHSLTERTLFTEQGQLIGTPEYMSPEQAEMSGLDVDTRTDIYSLGVILYELLVGVLPFDPKSLREVGFGEIQRIIRETEPPRASSRLSSLGDTQTSIAEHRKTDPNSLKRELKGDLDWITLKAMAKDRTQRYASASELADDIERYLIHDPITAGRQGAIYRIRKYIRRHKVGVAAAALVIIALFIGGTSATIGFVRATKAERFAKKEAQRASQEAQTATQVSSFLIDLFKVSDPSEARGNTITAREILDRGANNIKEAMKNEPEVQSNMMAVMGKVYTSLGLFKEAGALLEHAIDIQRRVLGKEHPDTLTSIHNLANLYYYQDRTEDAELLYLEAVEARKRVLGEKHPDTLKANYDLASLYLLQGRWDESEQLSLQTLEIQHRVLGNEHPDTAASMHLLAFCYYEKGQYKNALSLYEKAAEIRLKVLGEDHPDTIYTMGELAAVYEELGNSDQAEKLYVKNLELSRSVFGNEHPDTIISMFHLANCFKKNERFDEAEKLFKHILTIGERVFGSNHRRIAQFCENYADLLHKMNRGQEAKDLEIRANQISKK